MKIYKTYRVHHIHKGLIESGEVKDNDTKSIVKRIEKQYGKKLFFYAAFKERKEYSSTDGLSLNFLVGGL